MVTTPAPTPIGRRPELGGRFAPVPDEIDAVDLPVEGTLPPELTGRYLRNGPNRLPGEEPGHLFTAHGMLHGVRLREGRAEWYRNRWVRTRALEGHPFLSEAGVDLAGLGHLAELGVDAAVARLPGVAADAAVEGAGEVVPAGRALGEQAQQGVTQRHEATLPVRLDMSV